MCLYVCMELKFFLEVHNEKYTCVCVYDLWRTLEEGSWLPFVGS